MLDSIMSLRRLERVIAVILVIFTAIIGMFLPVFTGPDVSEAFINVPWGTIYGVGFLFAKWIFGLHPGPSGFAVAAFGMIIWPVIVAFGSYFVFRRLSSITAPRRYILMSALVLTLIYDVKIGSVRGTFVETLPLFSAFLDI